MIIKNLSIRNFRNIASADLSFDPKVNIFTGNNAQGKTNLCEAISVCLGKSFRNPRMNELIPFGNSTGELSVELTFTFDKFPEKENTILYLQKNSSSRITFNGLDMKSAEELYGALRYVIFVPEDLLIVKGGPEGRRDYIDFVTNMINRVHMNKLHEYNKALRQKNNILMRFDNYSDENAMMLESWNDTLARLGVNVMCGRLKYFDALSAFANDYYTMINNNGEKLSMRYESTIMRDIQYSKDDVSLMFSTYVQRLRETMPQELKMKYTVVGSHRDDISFFINDMPSKTYSSQGQIRSISIALKLAEARMIHDRSDDIPVIILDDVLSELDTGRRNFIINHIENFQTFITSCNINDLNELSGGNLWSVKNGRFVPI